MRPELVAGDYVFCSFADAHYGDHAELEPIGAVMESEGLTLIVPKCLAEQHGIEITGTFNKITLNVHSSLEAVGLTAAFAKVLTEQGISANVVAGYFHDHIFVQKDVAASAMNALMELSQRSTRSELGTEGESH